MENAQNTAGSSLAAAVERLDGALSALESRIKALQMKAGDAREGEGADPMVDPAETEALKSEIEALKAREKLLEDAASGAFEALGVAAKDIRQLLNEQAA